ncbi:MAG: aminotransferase class I/II-fold pyridoxal phosphate-dependent enzyme [Hamadaea sp.]|nr:aminotransferase class I/II-fold pyridoxal phosphate-dependent enzyme [Hamadaea sp.]
MTGDRPRFLPEASLRSRTSLKWSRALPGEIPADIAELDVEIAPVVHHALSAHLAGHDFGYPDYTGGTPRRLAELFAERAERKHGWRADPGRVDTCAQIVQALCCALLAFTRPGDAVVTHAPTYPPFLKAIRQLDRRCVTIPVRDLQSLADLHDAGRARMVVLCQPHNPTGHVFGRRTLEVLGEFAESHDAVVFSDEIHQDLVHAPHRHLSAAAIPVLADRTIVFTSAAKTFNIAGLRCAVGHFGAKTLYERYTRLPWHLRSGAGLLGIAATIAAWDKGDAWADELRARLSRNRATVDAAVRAMPAVRWTPPPATYLAWLDLRRTCLSRRPADSLRDLAALRLQRGRDFGDDFTGFVRLNFGTSEETLSLILRRMTAAITAGEQPAARDGGAHPGLPRKR